VATKTDKITHEHRIQAVLAMIHRGWSSQRIVENGCKTWDISHQAVYGYIKTARNRIAELYKHKLGSMAGEILSRHDDLREKGYAGGDHRLVLDVDKEDAKLLGLYPAEKHEHDITGIDNAIARELARLAGRAEAGDAGETEGA